MAESGMNVPSGMGGLMRYNEEYPSKIQMSPAVVVAIIVVVVAGMAVLKLFL